MNWSVHSEVYIYCPREKIHSPTMHSHARNIRRASLGLRQGPRRARSSFLRPNAASVPPQAGDLLNIKDERGGGGNPTPTWDLPGTFTLQEIILSMSKLIYLMSCTQLCDTVHPACVAYVIFRNDREGNLLHTRTSLSFPSYSCTLALHRICRCYR